MPKSLIRLEPSGSLILLFGSKIAFSLPILDLRITVALPTNFSCLVLSCSEASSAILDSIRQNEKQKMSCNQSNRLLFQLMKLIYIPTE